FLFEAKLQGRLEHPAIVPVYDIGKTPDGRDYFTMKRVHGETLYRILQSLRAGDEQTKRDFPRRRLLAAFQSACQAMAFAHQRGVVHRDLKPSNFILGSAAGEVAILDWGLAKVRSSADTAEDGRRDATAVGEVMGTPGYMAPEQALGTPDLDGRADIFS